MYGLSNLLLVNIGTNIDTRNQPELTVISFKISQKSFVVKKIDFNDGNSNCDTFDLYILYVNFLWMTRLEMEKI